MNEVFLIGRLTADPTSGTGAGKTYCKFTVAVNRGGAEQKADFINVVCWEKLAENCKKYLSKGKQIAVNGSIQTGSYEKDGVKRQTFDVRARQVEFLSKAETKDGNIDELPEADGADMPF